MLVECLDIPVTNTHYLPDTHVFLDFGQVVREPAVGLFRRRLDHPRPKSGGAEGIDGFSTDTYIGYLNYVYTCVTIMFALISTCAGQRTLDDS